MPQKYWLMKNEPDAFSIRDLRERPDQTEPWDGIRNYQARNFMRDDMKAGDLALFYHSNCKTPGAVGVMEIVEEAIPDPTAWDPDSDYFDEKASPDNPRWCMVTVKFVEEFPRTVSLDEIKADPKLSEMRVAQRGNRLSITPVKKTEFDRIRKLAQK